MAEEEQEASPDTGNKGRKTLIILAAAVVVMALMGFGVARMLSPSPEPVQAAGDEEPAEPPLEEFDMQAQFEYIEFGAVTVNLDEPRMARYLQALPILAVRKEHKTVVAKLIELKMPELNSWLTVYLHGCTLDDVRGTKNLNRIRRELRDAFNDQLFGNGRPLINHVLFKEFKIQ